MRLFPARALFKIDGLDIVDLARRRRDILLRRTCGRRLGIGTHPQRIDPLCILQCLPRAVPHLYSCIRILRLDKPLCFFKICIIVETIVEHKSAAIDHDVVGKVFTQTFGVFIRACCDQPLREKELGFPPKCAVGVQLDECSVP